MKQFSQATWVKSKYAEDADGVACDPAEPQAVRWCMMGWLHYFYDCPPSRWDLAPNGAAITDAYNRVVAIVHQRGYLAMSYGDHKDRRWEEVESVLLEAGVPLFKEGA